MFKDKARLFDLLEALVLPILMAGFFLIPREQFGIICLSAGLALLGIRLARQRLPIAAHPLEVGSLIAGVMLLTAGFLLTMRQDFVLAMGVGLVVGLVVGTVEMFVRESRGKGLE